jgi:hypothetical protein
VSGKRKREEEKKGGQLKFFQQEITNEFVHPILSQSLRPQILKGLSTDSLSPSYKLPDERKFRDLGEQQACTRSKKRTWGQL